MQADLGRRLVAEALGTAFLLAIVIGSGIMAERLAGGNVALALLANTVATGAGLVPLLLSFGPISGAHLNPAVTLADAAIGGRPWREVPAYVSAQLGGPLPAWPWPTSCLESRCSSPRRTCARGCPSS